MKYFLRKIRLYLRRVPCHLGFHNWGSWQHMEPLTDTGSSLEWQKGHLICKRCYKDLCEFIVDVRNKTGKVFDVK